MSKKVVTLYLNEEHYQALKKMAPALGKSISETVDEWITRGLEELTGEKAAPVDSVDYGKLKREHARLVAEVEKGERALRRRKAYDELMKLAFSAGLKNDLSNVEEVAPSLINQWISSPDHILEDAHTFISYLETVREKKLVERRLTAIRSRRNQPSCEDRSLGEAEAQAVEEKPRPSRLRVPVRSAATQTFIPRVPVEEDEGDEDDGETGWNEEEWDYEDGEAEGEDVEEEPES